MLIETVEYTDVRVDHAAGKCVALVTLNSQGMSSTHYTVVDCNDNMDHEDLKITLFAEAFRQMSRMPEFRSGKRELTYSTSIIPQKLSSAA